MTEEIFVVGDVQGCHAELCDLLAAAGFDRARHRLAFVGDLINRGPSSRAVLELARDHSAAVVLGNHEASLVDGLRTEGLDRVRAELGAELDEWLRWIGSWPLFMYDKNWILVHAGIAPGKRPEECTRHELIEIRNADGRPWFDAWPGPETVVFGHWAMRGKVDRPLAIGLDTGCVYGRELTGVWMPSRRWVSVPARRVWYDAITKKPTWI